MVMVDALAGTFCSEVAPDGQRMWILMGGTETEYEKKQAALDWL